MTTHLRKAAWQALEALKDRSSLVKWQAAREALYAALKQPAQDEPVGEVECIDWDEDGQTSAWLKLYDKVQLGDKLYTHPKQPAQDEPVAWINWCAATGKRSVSFECESELASEPLYAGITQNTQDHYSKFHSWFYSEPNRAKYSTDDPAYLAAQEAWQASGDLKKYNYTNGYCTGRTDLLAEIEAWKARFKIAEDALVKHNGAESEPLTFDGMTAQEFALKELYAFQEATGCDTADQIKAREPEQQEPVAKPPGMAVQALAGEIIEALLADEEDGGYDLTAGLFGANFSKLVRRWAQAEWASLQEPEQQESVAFEYFKDWMVREIPPMTTIGNPEWWAKRIYELFIHTRPQARKPLTEAKIIDANWVGNKAHITACPAPTVEGLIAFARAIEAAHGIGEKK